MTMHLCHRCKARPFICCDVFGRWMCQPCASKWLEHIKDVVGTADGQAWCCEERTDSAAAEAVAQDQAAEAGSGSRLMEGNRMLVLSRKKGEQIVIGDSIVVEVTKIKGSVVRLAVHAPADVRILRSELDRRDDTTTTGTR